MEYILIARTNSALAGRENIFLHKKFYLKGILNNINDCKHKHMMKSGVQSDRVRVLHCLLPIEFHGFTSRIYFKVLSLFISWFCLKFFRDGMGPFKMCRTSHKIIQE